MTARVIRLTRRAGIFLCIVGLSAALLATKVACSRPQGTPPPAVVVRAPLPTLALDPTLPVVVESVVTPVRAARSWASALAPNRRGGWNFITQSFELYTETPPEFVVVDLESGRSTIHEGTPKIFTNPNFTVGSELRAANGRIFFPGVENTVAYYDPEDETVKELGPLISPAGDNKSFHQAVFGPDGKLYLGTHSNKLPTIVQLDPVTLKSRVIGQVGKHRQGYSYAYEMAVDPPWVYVAVGQSPWELAAINIKTGASKILATRTDRAFMKIEVRRQAVAATLITNLRAANESRDIVWCVDGKTFPLGAPAKPGRLPFKTRNLLAKTSARHSPPEVDLSAVNPDANGVGRIRWRPAGSNAAFRVTQFQVRHTSPVNIESLLALPDGTLLGNAKQYHGFFRYRPGDNSTEFYGAHGPSQGPRTSMNGIVYMTGYPKGVLYAFDPRNPWTSTLAHETEVLKGRDPNPNLNPRRLGNFRETGAHYAYFLVPSRNGRLYFAGRRERDGYGGGVGYHDVTTGTFGGHHERLGFLDPEGLVVLDGMKRVVYSGKLRPDPSQASSPTSAELVIYDYDLKELERQVVEPGLRSTGSLFPTSYPGVVVGLIAEDKILYRYDVGARRLLRKITLGGRISASTRRASDGSIWLVQDNTLIRVDPERLTLTQFGAAGAIPDGANHLTWQGDDLYMTVQGELRRANRVGKPREPN